MAKEKDEVKELIEALKSPRVEVRAEAIWNLGLLRDKRAVEPLIEVLLNDKVGRVRAVAAWALWEIGDVRAADAFIKALENDPHPDVKIYAICALDKFKDKRAIEPLIKVLLNDPHPDVKIYAAQVLGNMGDKRALEPLVEIMKSDLNEIYEWVHKVENNPFSPFYESGVDVDKVKAEIKYYVAVALGRIGDERVIDLFIEILKTNPDEDIKKGIAYAFSLELGKLPGAEKAIDLLKNVDFGNGESIRCSC